TDWQDYAQQMREVFAVAPGFVNLGGTEGFTDRCPDRPLTRFEQRGQRLGHAVWDLSFSFSPRSRSGTLRVRKAPLYFT
ncbi:MAG: hypothetical protein WCP34_07505, partial [Pseudomonadota bacterium]